MMDLDCVQLTCGACRRRAVAATLDQEAIYRCPECDEILYRAVGGSSTRPTGEGVSEG